MNELIKVVEGEVVVDSRMIAEHFGKEHKNVLRDIQDEISKLGPEGELIFEPTSYIDQWNRSQVCYTMSGDGALQLAARYDAVSRRKLIVMLREVREAKHKLPQTYSQALLELAHTVEKNEQLMLENKAMQPKAEFYDDVVGSKDTIDMGTVAKVLNAGVGRNELFKLLRSEGVLMSDNKPYQSYVDRGWFRMVESKFQKPNGDVCINIKTVVFQKGVDGIRKIVNKSLKWVTHG
jgi:Rha family phage regulatory protein